MSKDSFKQSTFTLGDYSTPIGWIAVVWLFITSSFFVLPLKFDENLHQRAEDFNYTGIVLTLMGVIAMIYWYLPAPFGARHFFKGPKREDDDRGLLDSAPLEPHSI